MKIKTSELTGPALDWAVAVAEGYTVDEGFWVTDPAAPVVGFPLSDYDPSTDWAQGGPIIERELICTCPTDSVYPGAPKWSATDSPGACTELGATPLVAAMRCYIASKFGDEVEIPQELLS